MKFKGNIDNLKDALKADKIIEDFFLQHLDIDDPESMYLFSSRLMLAGVAGVKVSTNGTNERILDDVMGALSAFDKQLITANESMEKQMALPN